MTFRKWLIIIILPLCRKPGFLHCEIWGTSHWFSPAAILLCTPHPAGNAWQCLETPWVVTTRGMPLTSVGGGQRAANHPTLHRTTPHNKESSTKSLQCWGWETLLWWKAHEHSFAVSRSPPARGKTPWDCSEPQDCSTALKRELHVIFRLKRRGAYPAWVLFHTNMALLTAHRWFGHLHFHPHLTLPSQNSGRITSQLPGWSPSSQ